MFLWILIIHFFGLILPGPDFFLVSSYALREGIKSALKASLGVSLAMSVWIILSILGLSVIFYQFPFLQIILSSFGASYLLYLSFIIYKNAKNGKLKTQNTRISAFLSGIITNLSNPKAIFYFASVFANFNFIQNTKILTVLIFVLIFETIIYFSLISLLFSKPFMTRIYEKNTKSIDYLSAFIFFAFAVFVLSNNLMTIMN
ncbi:LysE family transporter [Campylobacter sp. RM16704]|uniref:LysE family transporter n=1 Tax=Campylobacter sp. RM16704 TaxID=1500960 RepID=UPI00057CE49A|nr:LysE family transporter [Campylobacter sp. RM16704]AJC86990.1 transporter, LysE family [Campylobacter sp. RM16704]